MEKGGILMRWNRKWRKRAEEVTVRGRQKEIEGKTKIVTEGEDKDKGKGVGEGGKKGEEG